MKMIDVDVVLHATSRKNGLDPGGGKWYFRL